MSNALFPSLPGLNWNVVRSPRFSTKVQTTASGKELRSSFWTYPIWDFSLSFEFLRQDATNTELATLQGFFLARQGSFDSFLYSDPVDNTVTGSVFGAGDGVTTAFTLARNWAGFIEPIGACNGTPSIYVTDWQGTTLQYSSPRTNLALNSLWAGGAVPPTSWGVFTPASVALSTPAYTGDGAAAYTFTIAASQAFFTLSYSLTIGTTYCASAIVETVSGGLIAQDLFVWNGVMTGATISFPVCSANPSGGPTGVLVPGVLLYNINTGTLASGSYQLRVGAGVNAATSGSAKLSRPQFETGTTRTSFIGTPPAATATVTDYSQIGTTITFTTAPLAGASLSWTGSFYYRVRFKQDAAEFSQFMTGLHELKKLEFQSVK